MADQLVQQALVTTSQGTIAPSTTPLDGASGICGTGMATGSRRAGDQFGGGAVGGTDFLAAEVGHPVDGFLAGMDQRTVRGMGRKQVHAGEFLFAVLGDELPHRLAGRPAELS